MDNILWLLYFADVADSLNELLGFSIGLSIGASIVYTIGASANAERFRTVPARLMVGVAIAGLIVAAIPSKSTIYAIAAAKAGDQALHTETGGKAIEALNAWLDRQIAGDKEEPSK